MERGGLLDIGKIGFAPLIERRGHADHHGVHFRQAREIVGRREMLGANVLLNLGAGDVPDIALAVVELFDFAGIGVEADDAVPGFGKAQSQRQSHVAASDNSDFQLRSLEKFRLPLDRHGEF